MIAMSAMTACHDPRENKALKGIQVLPHFAILAMDSSRVLSTEQIPTGQPCVFFYFDPNCEHCQKETREIMQNQQEFRSVRFYFLSSAGLKEINNFYNTFHLDSLANSFVGADYQYTFFNAFLPSSVPYIAIYNNRKILTKMYNGEADIASLISNTRN